MIFNSIVEDVPGMRPEAELHRPIQYSAISLRIGGWGVGRDGVFFFFLNKRN